MLFKIIVILLVSRAQSQKVDPMEVIKSAGYKGENHKVHTVDGYLLTVFRVVPNKIIESSRKPPCLLMHGFMTNALEYLQLKNESLPFILAQNGYDVYIGNFRGTKFSSHINLNKKSSKFWDFSFHEMGVYDLSATIDYVLHTTKSKKLFLVGFSQGSAASMALLSTRPEYNQKIIQAHLIAPAVYLGSVSNAMIKSFAPFLVDILKRDKMLDLDSFYDMLDIFTSTACFETNQSRAKVHICSEIFQRIQGSNNGKSETGLEVIRNIPNIMSRSIGERQSRHLLQLVQTGQFRQYDHGIMNAKIYGSQVPPEYDLRSVVVPIYIYYGETDIVVVKKDVERFRDRLQNVVYSQSIENFNHYDCVGSRRAVNEIYMKIANFLNGNGRLKPL